MSVYVSERPVVTAQWPAVNKQQRGQAITRRRVSLGIRSVNEFRKLTGVSRNAITAAEEGHGSENTYVRLETWLDRREEESGYEPGEVLRTAEARDAPPEELAVMEFDVEGPSKRWHVRAKASKGNADEAIAALAKLIHELNQEELEEGEQP